VLHIGLTGGIGSGKSTAAAAWAALGASVIDADAIARELTAAGGAAIGALRARFGDPVIGPDGALDRTRMRTLAFEDDGARAALEAILHPLIRDITAERAAQANADVVVFDVPLLVESGQWRARVHKVLVIDCAEATQLHRVVQRPGWTQAAARAVIARQAPRALRREAADAVIHNDDGLTPDALALQVRALWTHWASGARNDRSHMSRG
jgi:dephospho-CoA kinase